MDWIGLDWIGLDWIGLDWIIDEWNKRNEGRRGKKGRDGKEDRNVKEEREDIMTFNDSSSRAYICCLCTCGGVVWCNEGRCVAVKQDQYQWLQLGT